MKYFYTNEPHVDYKLGAVASIPEQEGTVYVYLTPDTFSSFYAVRAPAYARVSEGGRVILAVDLEGTEPLSDYDSPGAPYEIDDVLRQEGQMRHRMTDKVSVTFDEQPT